METTRIDYNKMDLDIERRVDELLGQMTLQEKVGQLVLQSPYGHIDWVEVERQQKLASERGEVYKIQPVVNPAAVDLVRAGKMGSFIADHPAFINRLQHIAVEESRLHIPLLVGADVIHGFRTTFPIPLAEACTWNPELLERAAHVAAIEASTAGVRWIFAPMVDVARDPRWGRIAEGAGEDPYLGGKMAEARVRGFQTVPLPGGVRIASCPKHFAGYGAAEGGRDYNTAELSERTLRQIYLPPFKAGFDAGAASTMSAFQDLGGVPATCNRLLLRTVLREEWDWQGVVVTDYSAVSELIKHGVAKDLRDAARLAILAGVDIDMDSKAYLSHLQDLVEDGTVPLELVEQAVRRVLRLKMNLGLFENPYVDESLYEQNILLPESRLLALEAARQSMVLIKNEDGVLPIARGGKKVALIGPLADSRADMLGTWASAGQPMDAETVLEGFQTYLAEGELIHVKGCETNGIDGLDIPAAVQAAQAADFVVLAVGEGRDLSGEARSRVHIELPGRQQELVDAIKETGKPLVVVLMSGRPLVIPRLAGQADALLIAWHAGIRTGQAVADLIFGEANPSGKLTVSWPRAEGQIPVYYNHKSTGRPAQSEGTTQFKDPFRSIYLDEPNEPLFAFGQGMSYTIFEYSDLVLDTPAIAKDGILAVSALVRNTGQRPGVEIVQLYIRDLVASVSRPVKELKGFQRISLQPGEAARARFELPASDLGYTGLDMKYVIEPGEFKVWIGPDSISGLESDFIVLP